MPRSRGAGQRNEKSEEPHAAASMLTIRRYLEGPLKSGVMPRDTPTVAKALQFSKKISRELMEGSRAQIRTVKQPIQAQETTTVITQRATVRWSMRRRKNST